MAEIWKPQPLAVYISWIEAIEKEASDKLSDWENTFVANIIMRLDNGYTLTQSQAEKLEQIYTKHTS